MNICIPISLIMALAPAAASAAILTASVASPDGKTRVSIDNASGTPLYNVSYDGKTIIADSPLGLVADYADFSRNLTMTEVADTILSQHYHLRHSKKSDIDFNANALTCDFATPEGAKMAVEFVVADNNVAFRYFLPRNGETGSVRVMRETSGFRLPEYATGFLTPQSDPMIGWKRTKPSYEEEYIIDAPLSTRSQYGRGFTFPALFRVGDDGWALVSETGVDRRYCGSRLSDADNGLFSIEFPMPEENNGNGTSEPAFSLPGHTPWRTITVGDNLSPIVETTIPWDLVEPRFEASADYKPGKGTWSWILWQDNSINLPDLKKYVDLAAEMGYPYTLVDNWWDTNLGREGIKELVDYAKAKGVTPLMWYSSSGYWNDIVQGPTNRFDNPITRKEEMKWLKSLGIKGVKVDFFGGDKQETMRLYEDILSDANDYGLTVIFHGCTLPRGWERMYPNYVGSEAVLASENLIFQQHFCDKEAENAALHPFIRNAVGSMEFGGTFLNHHMSRDNKSGNTRRTTDAFELATAVLFQSPAQNFAIAPNNLDDASQVALDFLRDVPTLWDDTRLIDGYPGKYVVLARRHADKWYVAGINATDKPMSLQLDLSMLGDGEAAFITDANDGTPAKALKTLKSAKKTKINMEPQGGFVIIK